MSHCVHRQVSFIAPFQLCIAAASEDRELQIADWHVNIDSVSAQAITFETGLGGGTNPNIKVGVSDLCRMEATAASRTSVGEFFPSSTVVGIDSDFSGVVANPGIGNSISFAFVEGINGNTQIYSPEANNQASVNFCIEVGLYEDAVLINYAEVKMTYAIDLVTNFPTLTGYTVSQAEAFNDATDVNIEFDGTLEAYFCNPTTHAILTNDGTKTHQGSIMNVCVKTGDGQFEVADIMELTIKDAVAATPSQLIITGSAVNEGPYATKTCTDTDATDTNICVISFLLKADFYEYEALTLTGTGTVLLEFGDATGSRRRLRRELNVKSTEEDFTVTATEFQVDQVLGSSATNNVINSIAAFGAIAGAAMVL